MRRGLSTIWMVSLFLIVLVQSAGARDDDVELWTQATVYPPIAHQWNGLIHVRFRFNEDVSNSKDMLLRGAADWSIRGFDVGAGYDYLYSFDNSETAEHRAFQRLEHHWLFGDFSTRNRLRLDERWVKGVDGVIARLRHRLRVTHPIASTRVYGAISNEVFFNLNDRGRGPVHGFEQNRLGFSLGAEVLSGIRIEAGYQWQRVSQRGGADIDRHVFSIQFSGNPARYKNRVGG